MSEHVDDKPVNGKPSSYAAFMAIVSHPALRIGFLDAQLGRPFDHENIMARIKTETPPGALKRLGFDADLFDRASIELAQYRYEEGRILVVEHGLRCKAWGHPDFPPSRVQDYIWKRLDEDRAANPPPAIEPGTIIAAFRTPAPPLLSMMQEKPA